MIVSFDDFILEHKIPNLQSKVGEEDKVHLSNQRELLKFIEYYEPEYLLQFLGDKERVKELYEYHDLEESLKNDEKTNTLIKSLKLIISRYIAYYYFRNETVQNTGIGASLPLSENSKRTNNMDRMIGVWNKMVFKGRDAYIAFFGNNYPKIDIFITINFMGI